MKNNFYILIAVLLLFNKTFSQKNNVDENLVKKEITEQDKRLLKEAKDKSEIIIEGTVIKCDEYYNKAKSAIYTLYTVKINTGIKGNFNDSIIEIVNFKDFGDEVLPIEMYPEPVKNLNTGYKAIFFTNLNKFELNENSDLAKKYYGVYKQVMIPIIQEASYTTPVAKFKSLIFMTKKDLYTEIGFFYQSLQKEKVLEARNPIAKELSDFILHTKLASSMQAKNSVVASAITFSFQNAVTTGTSVQKFYEFDVSASSSSNLDYLDFVQVDIDYSTSAFNSSVVANSNVTITNVPAYPSTKYPNFFKFDNASNILRVVLSADFSTPNRNLMTTTVTPLFHVKMKVNCIQNVNLSFTGATGGAYATTATSASFTNFSPVNDNDFDGTTACALNVLSISPTQVTGGRNEILTINGVNFGATQGAGFVKMKNANDGGVTFLDLDADDYVSWSNTQIKIRVPAYQRASNPVGAPVGSGVVIVSNGTSSVTSTAQANVYYSQLSYLDINAPFPAGFTSRKERIYATGNPLTQNYFRKFPIRIDSASCAAFPNAYTCIKKAIAYWICETKMPFVIIGTTTFTSNVPTDNSPSQNVLDGVSTIRFSDFSLAPNNGAIGKTFFRARSCDTAFASKRIGTLPEFDIEFDLNQIWFCDTSTFVSKPANSYDFYEVALHELGHATMLKHNNAFNSIMWYGSVFAPSINSGSRRIFLNIMDYLGGAQLVTDSKNISYQANCSFFAINTENCTGAIGIKENGFDSDNVTVQPNPFGDDLLIKIKTDVKSNINIKLNDVLGKTIKTFDNVQGAIGDTSVSYDGKELPSGVYFMSIQINNSLVVKKVIKR